MSPSWITPVTCSSSSVIQNNKGLISLVFQWLRFVFLSPCPQRLIFSTIDLIFLFLIFGLALRKLCSKFFSSQDPSAKTVLRIQAKAGWRFYVTLFATCLLAILNAAVGIIYLAQRNYNSWALHDSVFRLIGFISYIVAACIIAHEKKFNAVYHSLSLRSWWVASFLISFLLFISAILELILNVDQELKLEGIFSVATLVPCAVLLVIAVDGSTGLTLVGQGEKDDSSESKLREPLLNKTVDNSNTTRFESANLLSRWTYTWLNPLLKKGYNNPLKIQDVPSLAYFDKADVMCNHFQSNWPKYAVDHPVQFTLLKCFWPNLSLTASLAILRLCVMYVGPTLIQKFLDFTSGKRESASEGYYLVAILLVAKSIEVMCSHQYNFQCQRLGTLIRSTVITSLYQKGPK